MQQSKCEHTRDMFGHPDAVSVDHLALEVFEWAEATFPDRTDVSMFLKIYSEIAELIRSGGEPLELADLFILLMDYAVRKDINIASAVTTKLNINRQRRWKIGADGTMSHEE